MCPSPPFLTCGIKMNAINLIESLELQIEIQELKKLGLTKDEIEGFIAFEWDSAICKDTINLMIEKTTNDKH